MQKSFLKKNIKFSAADGMASFQNSRVLYYSSPTGSSSDTAMFFLTMDTSNTIGLWISAELFPALVARAVFFSVKYLLPNQTFPKGSIPRKDKFCASFFVK